MSAPRIDRETTDAEVVTEVGDVDPVKEGVEAGGAGMGEGIASGVAGGELVAGAFVAARLLSRLI